MGKHSAVAAPKNGGTLRNPAFEMGIFLLFAGLVLMAGRLPLYKADGWIVAGILCAFYIAAYLGLNHAGLLKSDGYIVATALLLAAALLIRVVLFEHRSGDYNAFLSVWVEHFRINGGFLGLSRVIGDYNAPYLYFLAAFSYFPVDDLYLIKLLSVAADLLLAWFCMRIVSHFREETWAAVGVFFAVLLLPTVWLNSGMWAQCDSIYAMFGAAALYGMLKRRPVLSLVLATVGFGFKLQIIFLLPIYLIFLLRGDVKFKHLAAVPAAYAGLVLPALLCGYPPGEVLGVYFGQVGSYSGYLTLNAPSIFAWVSGAAGEAVPMLSRVGIFLTAALLVVFILWLWKNIRRVGDREILLISAVMTAGIPFLLPSMHERYFYMAETLSVVLAFAFAGRGMSSATAKCLVAAPVLIQAGAYSGYHAYLFGQYIMELKTGALLIAAGTALILRVLWLSITKNGGGPRGDETAPRRQIRPRGGGRHYVLRAQRKGV
ncbi:hypothetical protein LJC32_03875 [Oscillospiraceae bacterium OttesenSCG-928-F05]|nr:hypothetical protein [Oscillospiraceae bacterium OttesenSCG-928-F05]